MPETHIIPIERITPLDRLVTPEALPGALYGGEDQAHMFIIGATRNRQPYVLSGTVTGTLINWSTGRTQPLEGTIADGKAVVTLPASCYAHPGRATITIFVTNENTLAVYSCSTNVIPTQTDEIIDPEDIINLANIQAATAQAQAAAATAAAAAATAAGITGAIAVTEASSTTTYAHDAGSYFFYSGALYRATDDIAIGDTITPKPATGYNCEAKTIGAELKAALEAASQVAEGAVRYDEAQALTPAQKQQARQNIGVDEIGGMVKYDAAQSLTDSQKAQARTNIGAASASAVNELSTAVNTLQGLVTTGLVSNVEAV